MNISNKPDITLGLEDAAVIIREDGSIELRLPKREDHESLPDSAIAASVIGNLLVNDTETMEIATNNFFTGLAEFKAQRDSDG